MKRPSTTALIAIVCAGATVAVFCWLVWEGENQPATSHPPPISSPPPTVAKPMEADVALADTQNEDPPGDDLPLDYHCPNVGATLAVHGRLSDECLAALDRRYGGISPIADYILPLNEPLTRRRLFDDSSTKRSAALAAIVDETCLVPRGSIMPDLADRCAADAIVEHALLLEVCNPEKLQELLRRTLRPDGLAEDLARTATVTYQEDYVRRYRDVRDTHYYAAYDYEMCSRVPDGVVGLTAWQLLGEGIAQDDFPDQWRDGAILPLRMSALILMEIAARLGSEWALARYVRDESHIKSLAAINPVLATLHRGRFERWRRGSEYDAAWIEASDEERARLDAEYSDAIVQSRLAHFIAADSLAAEHGVDFDLERRLSEWEPTADELYRAHEAARDLLSSPWWTGGVPARP